MIKIKHLGDHKYSANNGKDVIVIDPKKYSPVDYFITGIGNCSMFDVVELAKNKGYEIDEFNMQIEYERKSTYPKIFTEFHLIYDIVSQADAIDVRRWVLSSLETYCSTINTVRKVSKIYYTIKLNGEIIAYKEFIISGDVEDSDGFDDDDYICVA